jgi:hypothetical protein
VACYHHSHRSRRGPALPPQDYFNRSDEDDLQKSRAIISALLIKTIDFVALRTEIDTRIERAAELDFPWNCPTLPGCKMSRLAHRVISLRRGNSAFLE